jgi:glycosyltransferase involved in cell wall biosynthesis
MSTTLTAPVSVRDVALPSLAAVPPGPPLETAFLLTSMPIGGAETLLASLMRGFDRQWIRPQLVCLKELGLLGEQLQREFPAHSRLIGGKYDLRVFWRLRRLFRQQRIQAVVTVGAGDKMFWGRLAAAAARVPVVCCALHSTGWPDGVGRLNRSLTGLTDAFIAVAQPHGEFLVEHERFPRPKVAVIPNGVDCHRFRPDRESAEQLRRVWGLAPGQPLVGILAALRPEKNHRLFLEAAAAVITQRPEVQFVIIGDGPERERIEGWVDQLGLREHVRLLGARQDTPQLLAALDLLALTSHNEANPVSILEALACQVPVVATDVGSVAESVLDQRTGLLVPAGQTEAMAAAWLRLLRDPEWAQRLGEAGRGHVQANFSLERMVDGYQQLIWRLWSTSQLGAAAPTCQAWIGR